MDYDSNVMMEMFRKLSSQILIDLRELEGDYRASNLSIDKAQSILYMIIVNIGGVCMLSVDWLFFKDRPGMFWQMMVYRGIFLLFTVAIILVMNKTNRVRIFDQLVLGWIIMTMLSLLFLNF